MKKYVRRTLRRSEELRRLNKDHGVQAIGVYWILIEALEESETSGTLRLEQLHSISSEFGISLSLLELVVFDYGLFEYTDTEFFDAELRSSRMHQQAVSAKRRAAACKRWHKKSSATPIIPATSDINKIPTTPYRRSQPSVNHKQVHQERMQKHDVEQEYNQSVMQLHDSIATHVMQMQELQDANAFLCDFSQKKEKKQKKENIININYYIYTSKEKEINKEKDFSEKQEKEKSEQRSTYKIESTRKEKGCAEKEKRSADFFQAPELNEIQDYVKTKTYHVDPNSFFSYYQSIGWKVGSKKMANWQAAIDSWEYRHLQSPTLPNQPKRTHHNNLDINSLWLQRSQVQRVHG